MTLFLDGSLYATPRELHEALKRLLSLPDYYGMNADALHDCLSERTDLPNLYIACDGNEEVARALQLVGRVVEDLGGTVRHA